MLEPNVYEEELIQSDWFLPRLWQKFKSWRNYQEIERSREPNGRVRGRLTALEARNITMYGDAKKTIDEVIEDEVCRIEDLINYKSEKSQDTFLSTSIEYLDLKVREGIIKHFKDQGFKVYKTSFQGHPEKILIIDWTPNTKQQEEDININK
jgi:hypothetical protein